ncbi:MAG: DUF3298 and DUF4163 domain-containing protein [Clostridiales bacterium]|nr:DUF3298 and DUF4163 domain-containing protein [Clostridiales bacterium]
MKRVLCFLLALAMTLALAACGGQTEEGSAAQSGSSGVQPESSAVSPEESSDTQPESSAAAEESSAAEPETESAADPESSEAEPESVTEPEESSQSTAIEGVSMVDVTDDRMGEDGSTLLEFSYVVVTVTCSDAAVTAAIQADLDSELEDLLASADELTETRRQEGSDGGAYSLSQTVEIERQDGQVLTLLTLTAAYTGGAHGSTVYTPLCYDLSTGARITLADLGDGVADTCTELIVQLCDDIQAAGENPLFDDYADAVSDYVVLDSCFYLAEDGVVFLAGEYSIGPYAIGSTRFLISYNDLPELNQQYVRETDAVTCGEMADGSVYTLS